MKDFPGPPGEGLAHGPAAFSYTAIQDGDSRRDVRSPTKLAPLLAEGKVWHVSTSALGKVCLDGGSLLYFVYQTQKFIILV